MQWKEKTIFLLIIFKHLSYKIPKFKFTGSVLKIVKAEKQTSL